MTSRQIDDTDLWRVMGVHVRGSSSSEGCVPGSFHFDTGNKLCKWMSQDTLSTPVRQWNHVAEVGSIDSLVLVAESLTSGEEKEESA